MNKQPKIVFAQKMRKVSEVIDKRGNVISREESHESLNSMKALQEKRARRLGLK